MVAVLDGYSVYCGAVLVMRKKVMGEMLGLNNEDMHLIAVSSSLYTIAFLQVDCLGQLLSFFLSARIGGGRGISRWCYGIYSCGSALCEMVAAAPAAGLLQKRSRRTNT